jgi:hypothetical protein
MCEKWQNDVEPAMHRNTLLAFVVWAALAPVALAHPGSAIGVHTDGRVFFVDTGGGVFSIERNGQVVRRDGPAFHWFALDSAGLFRTTPWPSIPGGELRAVGANPTVVLSSDVPVAVGGGTFFFPERVGDGGVRIVAVAASGARSVRATLPPVRRGGEVVTWINGLAPGPNGSLYYTEDKAVRVIDARGRVTTLANVATVARCVAIPGTEADVPYLRGLAVAGDGTVYVAASGCGALLKISPRGTVAPLLRTASPWSPTAVAFANGEVFVLEYLHTASDDRREWLPRVRKITRDGTVVTLANTARR